MKTSSFALLVPAIFATSMLGATSRAFATDVGAEVKDDAQEMISEGCPRGQIRDPEGDCATPIASKTPTIVKFGEVVVEGNLTKPEGNYGLGRVRPHFDCDIAKLGTAAALKTCIDDLALQLSEDFILTLNCPRSDTDFGVIKKIVEAYAKSPHAEDLSIMRQTPVHPELPVREGHLPLQCGYNEFKHQWFKESIFLQGAHDSTLTPRLIRKGRLDGVPTIDMLEARADIPNVWQSVYHSHGETSDLEGGHMGSPRFIPLGHGIFVMTTLAQGRDPFAYGLVFVPSTTSFLGRGCANEQWLEAHRAGLSAEQIQKTQNFVSASVTRARNLSEVERLAEKIQDPATDSDAREQMTAEADQLLSVYKSSYLRTSLPVQSACEAQQALP